MLDPAFRGAGPRSADDGAVRCAPRPSAWDAWRLAYARARSVIARRGLAVPGRHRARGVAAHLARLRRARLPARAPPARWRAGPLPVARAIARCSPPRWRRSFASRACPHASWRASRPGRGAGGVFRVTDRDAHAWVEAWFPGYAWLPFDATPGRELPARARRRPRRRSTAGRLQAAPSGSSQAAPSLQLPRLGTAARGARGARPGRDSCRRFLVGHAIHPRAGVRRGARRGADPPPACAAAPGAAERSRPGLASPGGGVRRRPGASRCQPR